MRLFSELKRRNVLRLTTLYVVAAWLVLQVADVLIDLAGLPEWLGPATLAVIVVGLPIAIALSWFYELTPEGIALDKDRPADQPMAVAHHRTDMVIIALLSAAVLIFAWDKWWPDGPIEQSIAVLAFENRSGDPEQEYFSDGISEDILTLLARIEPLKVIARTSSFSFKGKDIDIATIASQLNVQHILEGSVRRSGDSLRITAQLIDAADSTQVWSQTYDRELGDIFTVQDEIAAAISNALKLQLELSDGEPVLPHAIRAANIEAYEAYLKGRQLFRKRGIEDMPAAVREFERALRLDDNFAPAHAQLAIATAMLGWRGEISLEEVMRIAVPHLDRAQALEPDLAEAYAGRGQLASLSGDLESAVENYRRALAINPRYGDALNWLYIDLKGLGRYEEADGVIQEVFSTDPLDQVVRYNYVEWLCHMGRMDEAKSLADQILTESPWWGNFTQGWLAIKCTDELADALSYALKVPHIGWASGILSKVGEYEEARRMYPDGSHWVDAYQGNWDNLVRAYQDEVKTAPDNAEFKAIAGGYLIQARRPDEALPLLERALAKAPEGRPIVGDKGLIATLWLAEARRVAGDEGAAQDAARIASRALASLQALGRNYRELWLADAMLAVFEGNFDQAIESLRKAIELGLREPWFYLSGSGFDRLRDDQRYVDLLRGLDAILAAEHVEVLQLACFNNPAPQEWQPLPETCEGVTRH